MHPAEEILNRPWPKNLETEPQESADMLAEEEHNSQEAGKGFTGAENAARRRDLLEQKRGACPILTLSLTANDIEVHQDSCISFKALLRYEGVPIGDNIPIITKAL